MRDKESLSRALKAYLEEHFFGKVLETLPFFRSNSVIQFEFRSYQTGKMSKDQLDHMQEKLAFIFEVPVQNIKFEPGRWITNSLIVSIELKINLPI